MLVQFSTDEAIYLSGLVALDVARVKCHPDGELKAQKLGALQDLMDRMGEWKLCGNERCPQGGVFYASGHKKKYCCDKCGNSQEQRERRRRRRLPLG